MSAVDFSNLQRELQPMPDDIRAELKRLGLMDAYHARPAYQQNDYLAWIGRAKRPATREKRLAQMLDELRRGDAYMNMRYSGKTG
ncbi:MAG: YdeI/OmpD-associated family protein [Anaerolineae bacterium]|nr:YdeI/OmpD-associated family protein [Anaerolineae bacterium]